MSIKTCSKSITALAASLSLSACSLTPEHLDDPSYILGQGPKVSDVVKSLRCEIITFLVVNRLRAILSADAHNALIRAKQVQDLESYKLALNTQRSLRYLPIDSTQYAALTVDFKNVDTLSLTLGYDWKKQNLLAPKTSYRSFDVTDYHVGPSYSDTRTFEYIQTIGLPQSADLGPTKDPDPLPQPNKFYPGRFSGVFFRAIAEDSEFYCYKSLWERHPTDISGLINDVQDLVENNDAGDRFRNFKRIYIGEDRGLTFAKWLQNTSTDTVVNQLPIYQSSEALYNGQLEYTFTIDVKPGLDLKYTLVAALTNPLVPEVSGSIEHSSQFAIFLNSPNSLPAFGAKTGNSCDPNLSYDQAIKINPYNTSCKKPGSK